MKQSRDNLNFIRDPKFIMLVFFIVLNVFFSLTSAAFFQLDNYFNMLKQAAMILITASAATILMMTGNFDLSTGSNLAFASVIYAVLAQMGMPLLQAAAITVMCGLIIGIVNGLLVSKMNFPPFIATLGMMYISRGVALIIAKGTTVREHIPINITTLARGNFFGIPIPVYLIVVFAAFFFFIEKKTLLGKYAMAIGGNKNAAFFSGINAGAIIFWIYGVVGVLSAFSGVLTTSRLNAGDPRGGFGFEFDVILAILLGGTSLLGGKGSVIGTLLGALVVAVLKNGLDMLNILTFWQSILKGVIFVLAIVLNEKILKKIGKPKLAAAKA
jgi:ribose/xylose/arabinose/galactoside ABC-type transport system permease subunit